MLRSFISKDVPRGGAPRAPPSSIARSDDESVARRLVRYDETVVAPSAITLKCVAIAARA